MWVKLSRAEKDVEFWFLELNDYLIIYNQRNTMDSPSASGLRWMKSLRTEDEEDGKKCFDLELLRRTITESKGDSSGRIKRVTPAIVGLKVDTSGGEGTGDGRFEINDARKTLEFKTEGLIVKLNTDFISIGKSRHEEKLLIDPLLQDAASGKDATLILLEWDQDIILDSCKAIFDAQQVLKSLEESYSTNPDANLGLTISWAEIRDDGALIDVLARDAKHPWCSKAKIEDRGICNLLEVQLASWLDTRQLLDRLQPKELDLHRIITLRSQVGRVQLIFCNPHRRHEVGKLHDVLDALECQKPVAPFHASRVASAARRALLGKETLIVVANLKCNDIWLPMDPSRSISVLTLLLRFQILFGHGFPSQAHALSRLSAETPKFEEIEAFAEALARREKDAENDLTSRAGMISKPTRLPHIVDETVEVAHGEEDFNFRRARQHLSLLSYSIEFVPDFSGSRNDDLRRWMKKVLGAYEKDFHRLQHTINMISSLQQQNMDLIAENEEMKGRKNTTEEYENQDETVNSNDFEMYKNVMEEIMKKLQDELDAAIKERDNVSNELRTVTAKARKDHKAAVEQAKFVKEVSDKLTAQFHEMRIKDQKLEEMQNAQDRLVAKAKREKHELETTKKLKIKLQADNDELRARVEMIEKDFQRKHERETTILIRKLTEANEKPPHHLSAHETKSRAITQQSKSLDQSSTIDILEAFHDHKKRILAETQAGMESCMEEETKQEGEEENGMIDKKMFTKSLLETLKEKRRRRITLQHRQQRSSSMQSLLSAPTQRPSPSPRGRQARALSANQPQKYRKRSRSQPFKPGRRPAWGAGAGARLIHHCSSDF